MLHAKGAPAAVEIAIAIAVAAVVAVVPAAVPEVTVVATPAAVADVAEDKTSTQLSVTCRAAAMRPFPYTADCEKCATVRGQECPRHTVTVRKISV